MENMKQTRPETANSTSADAPLLAVSAWMDGHSRSGGLPFDPAQADQAQVRKWSEYHFIGEVMRSQVGEVRVSQSEFLARWQEQRRQEATPTPSLKLPQQEGQIVASAQEAANAPRWRLVAGMMAVVLMVGLSWKVWLAQPASTSAQLAQQTVTEPDRNLVVVSQQGNAMVRDPELDELLMRHKQLGASSALQGPAGFLRSATFSPDAGQGASR